MGKLGVVGEVRQREGVGEEVADVWYRFEDRSEGGRRGDEAMEDSQEGGQGGPVPGQLAQSPSLSQHALPLRETLSQSFRLGSNLAFSFFCCC